MDKNYYPAKPSFKALTTAERERVFGKFKYESTGGGNIRILGNWVAENIVKVKIPQLIGIPGAPKDGVIQWHKKGVAQIKGFFQAVEDAGLLHLIISWAGSYNARFIRGSKTSLSNHAWATAFDINAPETGSEPNRLPSVKKVRCSNWSKLLINSVFSGADILPGSTACTLN